MFETSPLNKKAGKCEY